MYTGGKGFIRDGGIVVQVEPFEFAAAGDEPKVVLVAGNDFPQLAVGAGGVVVKVFAVYDKFFAIVPVEAILGGEPQEAFIVGSNIYYTVL